MPRTCTICTHPDHGAIDEAIIDSASFRDIARQWRVSKDAVARHKDHLPAQLVKAQEAEIVSQADDLLGQVQNLQDRALAILKSAEDSGALKTALMGIREARACLELLAKLRGQLDERPVINMLVLPEWQRIRSTIQSALEAYPEARTAVALALRGIDSVSR